jgi:saccharopine dehydrogenase (NADP+, L-glutamate forming)
VVIGDASREAALEKIPAGTPGQAIHFDIQNEAVAVEAISGADVVVSLLPAHFHPVVAKYCLRLKKHLLTASYVSPEMRGFDAEARSHGLLFLNECGLDPGIDHMSAMQVIDTIRNEGGEVYAFESFTGGLIAPETDPDNPWRYKFTWNPRNVVMAGQGTAKYLENGKHKYVPYQQLFQRTTPVVVPGYGEYEGYANRDSLTYIDTYALKGIRTMLRGTLRNKGYCAAWNVLVQLGCCDDGYLMEDVAAMTHADFINAFLSGEENVTVADKLAHQTGIAVDGAEMQRLSWAGLFSQEPVGLTKGTPAQILEHILNKRWKLNPGDRDMIVMWHRFRYVQDGREREIQASLIVKGDDAVQTAMAKTVGLPLGIAATLLLQGQIPMRGVAIPTHSAIYLPVMEALKKEGIVLEERQIR